MLTQRQKLSYNHLANLWKPVRSVNATTGKPADDTYTLAYSGVRCAYHYTDNLSDPVEGAGRIKRPTVFTTDAIKFEASQEVGADWIVKNVSILPDGSQSPLFGEFHRILGVARVTPNAGNRRANERKMLAQTIEKPPPGVS